MSVNTTSSQLVYYFSNYTIVEDFKVHYYYTYVHPVVTILAALANLVCSIVFAQRELLRTGPFFKYSLINSIGAIFGMLALLGFTFTRCGPLCPTIGYFTYETQVYELFVIYFGNSLYMIGSLIQIAISTQLYLSITQKYIYIYFFK